MNVKQVILYCDHWQNGGVESYLMNQLRHWDLSQMECTLLSAEKTTDIYDVELKELGVRQHVLLQGESTSPILRILQTFSRFKRYIREHPCDVLYLNLTNSVTMRYAKIAREAGVTRRVVHSHCAGIQPGFTRPFKQLAHGLAKRLYTNCATDWWVCSDKAAEFLFDTKVLPKVQYVPNAIRVERFAFDSSTRKKMREELCVKENERLIGTVGRFAPEKNQIFLLKAFALALKQNPALKLLLVGDGPLRASLEDQSKKLGIEHACIFYGFTDNVAPLYSAMDLFCLTSVLEGNPVSAIEAQANGCPCLLSDQITRQADAGGNVRFLSIEDSLAWAQNFCEVDRNSMPDGQAAFSKRYNIVNCAAAVQNSLRDSEDRQL